MRTPSPIALPLLLGLAALAGCVGSYPYVPETREETPVDPEPVWTEARPESGNTLYGWDGSPVGEAPAGSIERTPDPVGHPLAEGGGSRLVLLDLYQRAVEERDEYLLEVESQNQALELAEARYQELQARFDELTSAYDQLGAEKATLEQENQELGARLTTAQIRRLEAEKAWLEAAIAHQEDRRRERLAEEVRR